jgi:hypothetical protein
MVAATTVLLLSACTARPAEGDLTGTWSNSDGGRLVLTDDGNFQSTDLPARAVDFGRPADERFDGGGLWEASTQMLGGFPTVTLEFDEGPIAITTSLLVADPWWDDPRLFLYIGDPDSGDRYEFFKESE